MKSPKILTLLSDFGLQDPYVGVMKGAIAQIAPDITVIDLTHDLPPQNVAAARFALMSAYPYFPPGTVHVAVVDPGVGSQRRAVALELPQGMLVGPDNGLLSGVLDQYPVIAAVELTNSQYWRSPYPSMTFHGRDIFAPVGAHLAQGVPLQDLGTLLAPDTLVGFPLPSYRQHDRRVEGVIQAIDRFGNLITNIPREVVGGYRWSVMLPQRAIRGGQTYSDLPVGEAIALVGSHGWVELAINCGHAAHELGLTWGDRVEVFLHANLLRRQSLDLIKRARRDSNPRHRGP